MPEAPLAPVLVLSAVEKRYGRRQALRAISFSLGPRGVVGVLGPNGAGKTTLLEIIEGIRRPSAGSIALFGEPLVPRRYPKRRVGAVFQAEAALEGMRVIDYARLYAAIYQVAGGERDILARARLEERAKTPVSELSGGLAQRLYLAAASVHRPELLLLDEPTAHLDPMARKDIGEWIAELGRSSTVVLATHDLREAETVCDTLLLLLDGELRAFGSRAELTAAVPPDLRATGTLEDVFLYYCGARIDAAGERA